MAAPNPLAAKSHHAVFQKPGHPAHVEIQGRSWTDGRDLYPQSIDPLFIRSEIVSHAGENFPTPSQVDQYVFLIAHGVTHAWCLLHWVLDVAVVLHRMDEGLHREMAERIVSLGMERQLKLTVNLISRLFSLSVPGPFNLKTAVEV